MGNRFDFYERVLKESGGQPPTAGPVKEYFDWKTGAKLATYTRSAASRPGGRDTIGLTCFGIIDPDKSKIAVGLSRRANTQKGTVMVGAAPTLGHVTPVTAAYTRMFGFTPAKAIVQELDATQADTKVRSQITNKEYNPREAKSYTYPFGQTGTNGEADQGAAIRAALAAVPLRAVSFTPERIRV